MRDQGYHPGLDGVRAVAILLVLGQHAPTRPLIDGFVGVTVFFCLSGYLITTLLVRELQTGTIDVRAFYRRRAARLGPGLVTVVAATIVVLLIGQLIGRQDLSVGQIFAPAGAALAYATNLFDWTGHSFATRTTSTTHGRSRSKSSSTCCGRSHCSGAIVAILGCSPRFTVSLIGITLALNLYLGLSREVKYDPHEYFGSDTNALPILVGSLLAIVVHNDWLSRTVRYLAPCALPAVALLPVLAYRNDTYRCSLVTVAGTGLTLVTLIGVVTRPRSAVGSLLASGPMRWLGERSYSIYLWNILARIAILHTLGHTVVGDIAWIAMFVVLAEASFRFVERPLRAKFARRSGVSGPPNCDPVGVRVARAL